MKVAFTIWNGRVSPVFDVAANLLLVERNQDRIVSQQKLKFPSGLPIEKITFLSNEGVSLLVCGAISCSIQHALEANGIHVIPFRSGELNELIHAWKEGRLEHTCYAMPGCGGGGCRTDRKQK